MVSRIKLFAIVGLVATLEDGNAQGPSRSIQELDSRLRAMSPVEQQLEILDRLPQAVEKPEELDWLTKRLSVDLLEPEHSGRIAKCLLHVSREMEITPGAVQRRFDRSVPDPLYTLRAILDRKIVNDPARYSLDQESRSGWQPVPMGEEGALRELVAWGRKNGTAPAVLSAVENELNAFALDASPGRTTPASAPAVQTVAPASLSPTPTVPESPAPVVERKSPVWPWVAGIAAVTVIALLVWKRRT